MEHCGLDPGFDHKILEFVLCALSDNLGSHWVEALLHRLQCKSFLSIATLLLSLILAETALQLGPVRCESTYNYAVSKQEESSVLHFQGLYRNSMVNDLAYFRLSALGLPPLLSLLICFEGILQYDMMLYLDYFMRKN